MAKSAMSLALSLGPSILRASYSPLRSCGKIASGCARPEETNCWNCRDAVNCTEKFFCDHCHSIQPPPPSQNMFEYLGFPVSFEIEDSELKKRFRELQATVHPDKFTQASKHEREISDEHSRKLNESYKTLSEPFLRAKYLLKILGEKETKGKDLDPASLMEMMEWNEKVSEMTSEGELSAEKETVQKEIDSIMKELGKQFANKSLNGLLLIKS
ncbi:unnamed protein product [Cylicocyclus nassatus]|uniref:J domain-containing protein n=1 Tax=Cylicocyclus nassatus TaxID=53992 RepID=A0AA36M9U9_CYLNA|nr:unnamed protein product [Cylicocyclus nassatus]